MGSTAGKIKERRLERMRLGQSTCDFVALPSDRETRLAIVPLVEAEYRNVLAEIQEMNMPDDLAGAAVKDRAQSQWILTYAIREPDDLTQRVYESDQESTAVEKLIDDLEVGDIDELIDRYNEMVEQSSPSIEGIPTEELERLKKALQEMDWNELSGSAWFAAKRFLFRIMPSPLLDNSPGSTSTNSLTTTND